MEILTDAKGEYFADKHGSKHRRSGKNSWTLVESDMTQAHKDDLLAQKQAETDKATAAKDSAISAFTRIKSVLQLDSAKTKQFLRDTNEIMSYLDELDN